MLSVRVGCPNGSIFCGIVGPNSARRLEQRAQHKEREIIKMSEPFLPFALPDIGEKEIAEVVDTLRSGWLTTGPKTRAFEENFGAFFGDEPETVAVNSGTAGLHLALEALGVGPRRRSYHDHLHLYRHSRGGLLPGGGPGSRGCRAGRVQYGSGGG